MQIDTTNLNITMSILALMCVALIWWDIKHSFKEDQQRQKREKEEQEALGDVSEITLTRVKFQRYLTRVLDRVASEKITKVTILDDKEVLQGVLLSYGEYRDLLAFKHLYEYNAQERIKERLLWEEHAIKASHDEDYKKEQK